MGQEALDAFTRNVRKRTSRHFTYCSLYYISINNSLENFFSPPKEHTCQAFCNESFTSFVALTIVCSPFPVKDSTHCGLRLFLLIFFFPNTLVQLDLQILYVTTSLTLLLLASRLCLLDCLLFSKLSQPGTFLFSSLYTGYEQPIITS